MHVVDVLGLAGMEYGVMKVVNGLVAGSEIRSSILCLQTQLAAAKQILHPSVPVVELHKAPGRDLRSVLRMAAVFRRERIDIVHSHNWPTYFYSVAAARLAGVPVVLHGEHGREATGQSPRRLRLCRWLAHGVTHFVTVSKELAGNLVTAWKISSSRVSYIPNGVDLDRFGRPAEPDTIRRELGLADDCPVLLNVGRLVPVKDHPTLLRAFAIVHRSRPDARLLIIGGKSGAEGKHYAAAEVSKRIQDLIASLGIAEAVHLTETRHDVPQILSQCQLYLNSSVFEGMSNTILEAMASGKPVVATAVGGNPELVQDGVTGYLVPSGDVQQMADRILRLLQQPEQALAFGAAGRRAVEARHAMPSMIAAYHRLYTTLARSRPRGCASRMAQSTDTRVA